MNEVIALGERKKRVQQSRSSSTFHHDLVQCIAIFFLRAMTVERQLRSSKHDRDGGSQVVRGICGKLTKSGDCGLEACQQLIPGDSEILNLILRRWYGKTL